MLNTVFSIMSMFLGTIVIMNVLADETADVKTATRNSFRMLLLIFAWILGSLTPFLNIFLVMCFSGYLFRVYKKE